VFGRATIGKHKRAATQTSAARLEESFSPYQIQGHLVPNRPDG
jgi:hypothetical protein